MIILVNFFQFKLNLVKIKYVCNFGRGNLNCLNLVCRNSVEINVLEIER